MAWLTTHSSANKIEIESLREFSIYLGTVIDAFLTLYEVYEDRTERKYRYVGMTKAAADACVTAEYAAFGGKVPAGFSAQAVWRGDGGYDVDVIYSTSEIRQEVIA